MSKLIVPPVANNRRIEAYGLVMDVLPYTNWLVINTKGRILGQLGKPTNFSLKGLQEQKTEVLGLVTAPENPEDTLLWVGAGNPPPEKEIRSDTLVEAMIYGNERVVPDYTAYYAVSPSGSINVYSHEPKQVGDGWMFVDGAATATIGKTDPTDWQNSLRRIEKIYDDIPF